MYLNFKNILICIITLMVINLSITIFINIYKNEYIKSIVKSDSQELLKDYITYNSINTILQKYISSVENGEYNKIKNMSLFYAKKNNNEYKTLKTKLQLAGDYTLNLNNIYMLEKDIYKVKFNIKQENNISKEYIICIKVDIENEYFRVLDFII